MWGYGVPGLSRSRGGFWATVGFLSHYQESINYDDVVAQCGDGTCKAGIRQKELV